MIYTIVVNWKGWRDTLACLESLLAAEHGGMTVLVCDNASPDDSVLRISEWADSKGSSTGVVARDRIPDRAKQLRVWEASGRAGQLVRLGLIEVQANLGFAGGNNVGIAYALTDPACEHIFLLNNDTEVAQDAIEQLRIAVDTRPEYGLCGATLVYHSHPDTVQGVGGVHNKFTSRSSLLHAEGRLDQLPSRETVESQLDYVVGAAMFGRADLFRNLQGLNEDLFLYYEELDITRRLPAGVRLGWAPTAIVRHKVGSSTGTGGPKVRGSDLSIYYDCRSKLRYYWLYLRPYLPFAIVDILRSTIGYGRRGHMRAVRSIWLALADSMIKPTRYRRDFTARVNSPR